MDGNEKWRTRVIKLQLFSFFLFDDFIMFPPRVRRDILMIPWVHPPSCSSLAQYSCTSVRLRLGEFGRGEGVRRTNSGDVFCVHSMKYTFKIPNKLLLQLLLLWLVRFCEKKCLRPVSIMSKRTHTHTHARARVYNNI